MIGERETELSQPLGHTAELGTENKHGSSSKHSYNLVFVCSLSFLCVSLLYQVEPSRFPPECSGRGFLTEGQVPPSL